MALVLQFNPYDQKVLHGLGDSYTNFEVFRGLGADFSLGQTSEYRYIPAASGGGSVLQVEITTADAAERYSDEAQRLLMSRANLATFLTSKGWRTSGDPGSDAAFAWRGPILKWTTSPTSEPLYSIPRAPLTQGPYGQDSSANAGAGIGIMLGLAAIAGGIFWLTQRGGFNGISELRRSNKGLKGLNGTPDQHHTQALEYLRKSLTARSREMRKAYWNKAWAEAEWFEHNKSLYSDFERQERKTLWAWNRNRL